MKSNEGIVYEVSKSLDRILDLDKNKFNISVLLAVSGGSDSSCLMYVLNSIKDKYNMSPFMYRARADNYRVEVIKKIRILNQLFFKYLMKQINL